MEEKMARFYDVVDRLKSACNFYYMEERRSQDEAWRKYNSGRNVQEKDARRVEDPGDEVTDEVWRVWEER